MDNHTNDDKNTELQDIENSITNSLIINKIKFNNKNNHSITLILILQLFAFIVLMFGIIFCILYFL